MLTDSDISKMFIVLMPLAVFAMAMLAFFNY